MILIVFIAVAIVIYCVIHIGLLSGLSKLQYNKHKEQPFVSVIVAARNEEKNLPELLNSLLHQSYTNYEIIIANDRSTDRTAEILQHYSNQSNKIKIVTIESITTDLPPKKNALFQAIKQADGEILCFTDADCLPPSSWIEELVSAFDSEIGLVAGYSPYKVLDSKNILQIFVWYEEFRAALWSAGSIGLKKAWLCTGRNLAYRKKVFWDVGGFEQIKHSVSGDDDLFMLLVRKKTSWKIRYVTTPESFVYTFPPSSLKIFFEQRKRHFSAAKYFPFSMKIFFTLYHSANFVLLLFLCYTLISNNNLMYGVGAYTIKTLFDYLLIHKGTILFQHKKPLPYVIPMEVLYILYNSLVGPLGLILKFSWKKT